MTIADVDKTNSKTYYYWYYPSSGTDVSSANYGRRVFAQCYPCLDNGGSCINDDENTPVEYALTTKGCEPCTEPIYLDQSKNEKPNLIDCPTLMANAQVDGTYNPGWGKYTVSSSTT